MVQMIVDTLQNHRETAWIVLLARFMGWFLTGLYRFLDNERAVIHCLLCGGLAAVSIRMMTVDVIHSSNGYAYFRTHWPFTNHGWATVFMGVSIFSIFVVLMGRNLVINDEDDTNGLLHSLILALQFFASIVLSGTYLTIALGLHVGNKYGVAYYLIILVSVMSLWVAYRIHKRGGMWT